MKQCILVLLNRVGAGTGAFDSFERSQSWYGCPFFKLTGVRGGAVHSVLLKRVGAGTGAFSSFDRSQRWYGALDSWGLHPLHQAFEV